MRNLSVLRCTQPLAVLRAAKVASSLLLVPLALLSTVAGAEPGVPGATSGNYAAQYEKNVLRGVKPGDEFQINDLSTTEFGPAYANIWTENSNFLACHAPQGQVFSYALCYYSGPDAPTGSADNPALPCTLSADGKVANCKCYKLSTDVVPPQVPYFVDIHAILNKEIYEETVSVCGQDGSECAPSASIEAPVCDSVSTNQLMPGADLVSVFSPAMKLNYAPGSTSCSEPGSVYAGCMTAPCYDSGEVDENGIPIVDCSCPLYEGRFEIGQGSEQGGQPLSCDLGPSNVWSAAHNPLQNNPIDPIPPSGCTPDAPPEAGCALFSDETTELDPDGAVCRAVCDAYAAADQGGTQRGYSCDSTLCTTLGIGQQLPLTATTAERLGLMKQACSGVQDLDGLGLITKVEDLVGCSCCASQVCGCADENINAETNGEISELNGAQNAVGITPQCDINGTLCGEP